MEKKLMDEVKDFYLKRVKSYELSLKLENYIYGKITEKEKIDIEIKRLFLKFDEEPNLYNKVMTFYYEILNLYSDYKVMPTEEKLYNLKQKIINLQITCDMKIGMVSFLFEEKEKEKVKYIDENPKLKL